MRAPVPLVLLVLLFLFVFPAAAEIPVSRPSIIPNSFLNSINDVDVAAGDGFLVAWSGSFNRRVSEPILIRTYDADGTPRQELPVALHAGDYPQAFWNGREYVVLYRRAVVPPGGSEAYTTITATRVRPDGTIAGSKETKVTVPGVFLHGVAAWKDSTRALAAVTYDFTSALLLLDGEGTLIEETPVDYKPLDVILGPGGDFYVLREETGHEVAASDREYAFLSKMPHGLIATLLSADGNELRQFSLTDSKVTYAAIAWDGSAFTAIWDSGLEICTARFTSPDDVTRTCTNTNAGVSRVAIAGGHGRTFAAWVSGNQLHSSSGLASTRLSSAGDPDAVVDERGLLVAWNETTATGDTKLRIGGLGNDGAPRSVHVVESQGYQLMPRLARAGNQTLLTFTGNANVPATLLNYDGAPAGTLLDFGRVVGAHHGVAARAGEWLVAWQTGDGTQTVLLTRDLEPIKRQSLDVPGFEETPYVAATPAGFLLVRRVTDGFGAEIVVDALSANGLRTGESNAIHDADYPLQAYQPRVACNIEQCLVTWIGQLNEIWFALVGHDGARLTEPRLFTTSTTTQNVVIEARSDRSFRVWRGREYTPVSASGEPGRAVAWHSAMPEVGEVLTWRGNTTAVHARGGTVYATPFMPRGRAARH